MQFYIVSNKTPADTSKISAEKVQAKADELASKLANESVAESTPEGTAETAEAAETDNSDTKLLTYQQTYYSNNASFIKKNGADAAEKYKKVGGLYQIDGGYTVFGQVYEGFDVIDKINAVDVTTNASGEKSMLSRTCNFLCDHRNLQGKHSRGNRGSKQGGFQEEFFRSGFLISDSLYCGGKRGCYI